MNTTQFNSQILILSDKLFRLARSILRNDDEAKDAVQDLSLKLWEKRTQLNQIDNLQAFTMRSMRNLCLDNIRRRKNEIELQSDIESEIPNPHQIIEYSDMALKVRTMIDQLPELQSTIIRMRDVEGMELSEVAFITEISVNAVTVNLSRARQKIRQRILNENKQVEEKVWRT